MAENSQRLSRTGDQETDEILGEIEKEGVAVGLEEKEAPESDEESEQQGEEEEAVAESEESEEEAEEGAESEGGEGEEEIETSRPDRETSKSSSQQELGREEYWRKKAEKLQAQLTESAKKQSQAELQEKLKDLAAKEGIPLDRLVLIADVIGESVRSRVLSPDNQAKLDRAFKFAQREAESEHQDSEFEKEFTSTVLPYIPEGENVGEIYDWLYSELTADRPENYHGHPEWRPMAQVYINGGRDIRPIRRSGESSRIRSSGGSVQKPISQMSAEEIDNMSDEDFDKISDEAASSSPSLVSKRTL